MNPYFKAILLLTITLMYAATSMHAITVWHENRHAEIFKNHDCNVTNIEYEYFDGDNTLAVTTATCPPGYERAEGHKQLHDTEWRRNAAWLLSVLIVGLWLIRYLDSNQRWKNHHHHN